jgi:hypothetical protein
LFSFGVKIVCYSSAVVGKKRIKKRTTLLLASERAAPPSQEGSTTGGSMTQLVLSGKEKGEENVSNLFSVYDIDPTIQCIKKKNLYFKLRLRLRRIPH